MSWWSETATSGLVSGVLGGCVTVGALTMTLRHSDRRAADADARARLLELREHAGRLHAELLADPACRPEVVGTRAALVWISTRLSQIMPYAMGVQPKFFDDVIWWRNGVSEALRATDAARADRMHERIRSTLEGRLWVLISKPERYDETFLRMLKPDGSWADVRDIPFDQEPFDLPGPDPDQRSDDD